MSAQPADSVSLERLTDPEYFKKVYLESNVDPVGLEMIGQISKTAEGPDMVLHFSDYKKVNRVNIPFTTIMKQADKELNRILLDDVRFNVGASSIIFER